MNRFLTRVADLMTLLATRPAGALALAALYAASHLRDALAGHFLDEGGLDLWFSARIVSDEPWATLFFVETPPPLALLFAPVAAFGRPVFLIAHVLLSAAAIPLFAGVARALGHVRPNLTALALALCPLFYAACSAAPPESMVTTGLVLALFLAIVKKRAVAAGLVTGMVVLSNADALPLAIALGLALPEHARRRSFASATIALVTAYAVGFAGYHVASGGSLGSAFGVLSSFVDTVGSLEEAASRMSGLEGLADVIVAFGPTLAFVPLARRPSLSDTEWGLSIGACVFALIVWHLPLFGHAPMMPVALLPLLPFVALVAGRGLTTFIDGDRRAWSTLYVVALLAMALLMEHWRGASSLLLLTFLVALPIVSAHARTRRITITLLVGALVVAPGLFAERSGLAASHRVDGLRDTMVFFLDHPELKRRTIVTNVPILAAALEQHIPDEHRSVRFVRTRSRDEKLDARTSPGQREAIERMLSTHPTGRPVGEDELPRLLEEPGVLLVTANDEWQRALLGSETGARLHALRVGDVRVDEIADTPR